ncbi:MAG TPA: class I SAM-dependent methyltransferase [Acidimicrobiales bacterium]|jgi:SAM-dependent methyltransferase|nr:class I SAM-dependent methyltransferase [Acidimicrobiales bacterium]
MDNRDHWQRLGDTYRSSWDPPAKDELSRRELQFVARHLPPEPGTILDVGIGTGRIIERLLASTSSAKIYGVDVAESMVRSCAARFATEPRVVALEVCDVARGVIPFDTSFDCITAIRSLKYSPDWQAVVGALAARLTRDQGSRSVLVFSMPNRHALNRLSRAYAVPWEMTTQTDLRSLCGSLGLHVVEIAGFGRLPFFAYNTTSPAWLPDAVMALDTMLGRLLGPRFLTRELFVAAAVEPRSTWLRFAGERMVTVDRQQNLAEKSFLGPDADANLAAANLEMKRLEYLNAATAAVGGAASPRPLEIVGGPRPTLRMTAVAGRPLLDVLRSGPIEGRRLASIAAVAAATLQAYVAASHEPYLDFQFDNMTYDESSETIGFLDVGTPDQGGTSAAGAGPLEVSVGHLIGSTIFQSARPGWVVRQRQHRQGARLCCQIARQVDQESPGGLSWSGVHDAASDTYRRCATYGRWSKRLWYATGGYLLARRMRIGRRRFGPTGVRLLTRPPTSVPAATKQK